MSEKKDSTRPEERDMEKEYRDSLVKIFKALRMPGCPDLVKDLAPAVERLMKEREDDPDPVGFLSGSGMSECQCYEGSIGCLGPPCVTTRPEHAYENNESTPSLTEGEWRPVWVCQMCRARLRADKSVADPALIIKRILAGQEPAAPKTIEHKCNERSHGVCEFGGCERVGEEDVDA